jgi:hypothetical protein
LPGKPEEIIRFFRIEAAGRPRMTHPSPKEFIANLRFRMPWREKILLIIKNNFIKIKTLKNCCGHPGEPGC